MSHVCTALMSRKVLTLSVLEPSFTMTHVLFSDAKWMLSFYSKSWFMIAIPVFDVCIVWMVIPENKNTVTHIHTSCILLNFELISKIFKELWVDDESSLTYCIDEECIIAYNNVVFEIMNTLRLYIIPRWPLRCVSH